MKKIGLEKKLIERKGKVKELRERIEKGKGEKMEN